MRSLLFLALALPMAASAQYAGQHGRDIKALSADEVKQYEAGAGMGYARAAELNQYPGPMHALENADALKLTAEQRSKLKGLMDTHKAEARALGAELVAAERELDELFRKGNVAEAALKEKVRVAAALQGEYRLSHLETHRKTRELLTAEQVKRYDDLRGYAAGTHAGHHHKKH